MTTIFEMPSTAFSLPCFIPASKASDSKSQSKNNDDLGLFNDGELDFDLLADYLLDDSDFGGFSAPYDSQPASTTVTPEANDFDFADPLADKTFQIPFPNEPPKPKPSSLPVVQQPTLQQIAPAPSQSTSQTLIGHQHKRQRVESSNIPSMQQPMNRTTAVPTPYQVSTTNINQMQYLNDKLKDPRSGPKSQAQIDRRRERNRILARRTRLRKKFFFESLQKEVMDLQKENIVLKEIVRQQIEADKAKAILDSCKANEQLPEVVLEQCGDLSTLGQQDFNLIASIKQSQESFVITDPSLQDNPIVYASDGFLELTGYSRDQVLGRNCRFLQGEGTDQGKVAEIRKSLLNGDDCSVVFLNYCADGTPFWNKLFIAALRDAHNNIVNYIGVTVKVAGDHESDDAPTSGAAYEQQDNTYYDGNDDAGVDFDATIQAIEGAVTKAVEAAPKIGKHVCNNQNQGR